MRKNSGKDEEETNEDDGDVEKNMIIMIFISIVLTPSCILLPALFTCPSLKLKKSIALHSALWHLGTDIDKQVLRHG